MPPVILDAYGSRARTLNPASGGHVKLPSKEFYRIFPRHDGFMVSFMALCFSPWGPRQGPQLWAPPTGAPMGPQGSGSESVQGHQALRLARLGFGFGWLFLGFRQDSA